MEDITKKLKKLSQDELLKLKAGVEHAISEKKNDEVNKQVKIGSVYIKRYGELGYGELGYQIFKIIGTGNTEEYRIIDRFIINLWNNEEGDLNCESEIEITYDPGYTTYYPNLVIDIANGRYEPVDSSLYEKVNTIYSNYKQDQYKLDKEYFNKFISIL